MQERNTTPKARIPPRRSKGLHLSRKEKRALADLENALRTLSEHYGGKTVQELEKKDTKGKPVDESERVAFEPHVKAYGKAVLRAARLGLLSKVKDNPSVEAAKEWVLTRRRLGNREALRMARSGLEKGVKRPYTIEELLLCNEIVSRVESNVYMEWTEIQRDLLDIKDQFPWGKLLRGKSRESFRKLRVRLGLGDLAL